MTHHLDLDTLTLAKGGHSSRDQGICLLEARRRPDGTLGPVPVEDRLWCRVMIIGECWEFTGSRSDDGYGSIRLEGSMQKAHRAAYQIVHGEIPAGLVVMHTCDNPPCINPAHLVLGTVADNNRDRHAKGRTVMPANGPGYWRAKTHCPQGHPYSGGNVRFRPDSRRRCAECYRQRARERRAMNRST